MIQLKVDSKNTQITTKGQKTHQAILNAAMRLATIEGLEGISIGSLANYIGMSKSGLFAHFGSKEGLQLSIIDAARKVFYKEVILQARETETGLVRFWSFCDNWLSYLERKVFPGGCFFISASVEFDSKEGPVRDKIAYAMNAWQNTLKRELERAQLKNQLLSKVDTFQLSFEIIALVIGANWSLNLHKNIQACNQARIAILNRISIGFTEKSPALPKIEEFNSSSNHHQQ